MACSWIPIVQTKRLGKPRIRKMTATLWVCTGDGESGLWYDPYGAYIWWQCAMRTAFKM